MSSRDIVNAFLGAMQEGGDAPKYLADNFHFTGPMLQATSKAEFLKGLEAMGPMNMKLDMLKQFEDGDEVCSIYNFMVGTTAVLMSEWSVVRGNKIASQRLVFDTKAFEAAMGAANA